MKIGPRSCVTEQERISRFSTDSSRNDRAIAHTAKDENRLPGPFILDDQHDANVASRLSLESSSSASRSRNENGHFNHIQNESPSPDMAKLCESHQLVYGPSSHTEPRQETSHAISPLKTESRDEANLSLTNENKLGMPGGAKAKRMLLPKRSCWEQSPVAQPQKERNRLDSKATATSSKRHAVENKEPQKKSRTATATHKDKRIEAFACPYYRKYPERYFDCINLRLLRISDVKQHLKRRHTWNYSCSKCSRGFSLQKTYEEHVLQQECAIKDYINNDSDSSRAQEALKYRVDRRSSPELQWHEICRILFGTLGDTLNPHHDGIFKEITGIMRGIWRQEEQKIMSSLSCTRNIPCADELRPLLSEILSRVEGCFEQKEQTVLEDGLKEPIEKIQDIWKVTLQEDNTGDACESPKEGSSEMLNTGQIKVPEHVGPPTQEWHFSSDIKTSSMSNYSFTCLAPTQSQKQFEYSYSEHPAGQLNLNLGMDWHLGDPSNDISMQDFISLNSSTEGFLYTEGYPSSV
ncbi:hypothetical protein FBULB1_3946 [Fusarium bulbicola]|nr:hypothetical protein FBULB1_3946 [Fusarium bulbicola]